MAGPRWQRTFALVVSALFTASVAVVGVAAPVAADDDPYTWDEGDYVVRYTTQTTTGAPTNANVWVKLYGESGQTFGVDVNPTSGTVSADYFRWGTLKSTDLAKGTWPIGRVWKIDVGLNHSTSWHAKTIEVFRWVGGTETDSSMFTIDDWLEPQDPLQYDYSFKVDDWPWYGAGISSLMYETASGTIAKRNLLGSSVGADFKKEIEVTVGESVQLAHGVTDETQLEMGAEYKSPDSFGQFTVDFRASLSKEIREDRSESQDRVVMVTDTYEQWVAPGTLLLVDMQVTSKWDASLIESSGGLGAKWFKGFTQDAINFDIDDFRFGDLVPIGKWAAYIRKNLPKYVPAAALGGTGPFILTDPNAVPAAPPPVARSTKVVDDKMRRAFRKVGKGWKAQTSGFRSRSYWTPAQARTTKRLAIWRTRLDAPGRYAVHVFVPKKRATTRRAIYTIWTQSGKVNRVRSQRANRGRWVNLGAFDLGPVATVRLIDRTGEKSRLRRKVAADAVRFKPIGVSAAAARPKVVRPKVDRALAPAPNGEVKLRLYPKELEALVFARKTVSAWTCPAGDVSPFGPDKRPGTGDDACKAAVADWSLEREAAGRLNHRTGHKVLVQMANMQPNRLMADAGDGLFQGLPLTPLPRPADQPAPRLITEQ